MFELKHDLTGLLHDGALLGSGVRGAGNLTGHNLSQRSYQARRKEPILVTCSRLGMIYKI
jgi:hypothetical protein